eukprot:3621346-Rhodomonas_salina.6
MHPPLLTATTFSKLPPPLPSSITQLPCSTHPSSPRTWIRFRTSIGSRQLKYPGRILITVSSLQAATAAGRVSYSSGTVMVHASLRMHCRKCRRLLSYFDAPCCPTLGKTKSLM